jgi:hypothetical protein
MKAAQRKYDLDLVASLHKTALIIAPRSRKVSDMLRIAAARISDLVSSLPVDPEPQLDQHGQVIQLDQIKIQPASTPDKA